MNAIKFLLSVFSILLLFVQGQADDIDVVVNILEENELFWRVDELVTVKDGRVVKLNLDNKDFGKEGITRLVPEIGQLTELQELTINDNDLTRFPKEIFTCSKLVKLEIKNNNLISLPVGIHKLTSLRKLDLRNNELRVLPDDIVNLKYLVKLQLWGNELTMLPSQMGRLSSLKELYLRGNRLTGLPVSITKLKLHYLDMLENQLCDVPKRIDRWLKKFEVHYEMLQYCMTDYRFRKRNYE